MYLHQDGSMSVTEDIAIHFSEERHGIYRELPLNNEGHYRTITDIQANELINDISFSSDKLIIQLWSPETTHSGDKHYQLSYRVQNAIKVFEGQQELYRNLVGTERAVPIEQSRWSVHLPTSHPSSDMQSFAVWGDAGSIRTGSISFDAVDDTQWNWSLDLPLDPGQGITIWLQFSWEYFSLQDNYDQYFSKDIATQHYKKTFRDQLKTLFSLFGMLLLFWSIFSIAALKNKKRPITKPIVTQYEAPASIEEAFAFLLWHNNIKNPKLFSALVYLRATSWYIIIEKHTTKSGLFWLGKPKETYTLQRTKEEQADTDTSTNQQLLHTLFSKNSVMTSIYQGLLQWFNTFAWNTSTPHSHQDTSTIADSLVLDEHAHEHIKQTLTSLETLFSTQNYTTRKKWLLWWLGLQELTPSWQEYLDHLAGYKEYLSKVEKPVVESELKANPDFINEILPRAVLFGVETRLLDMIQDIINNIERYQSDDGTVLTAASIAHMNKSFARSSTPPHSSWSSGFSGGGGSVGGGWGWGWGGSR